MTTHPCNFDNTSKEIKETDKKGSKIEILLHGGPLCAMACGTNNKLTIPQIKSKFFIFFSALHDFFL
jgi:hypothetical protein